MDQDSKKLQCDAYQHFIASVPYGIRQAQTRECSVDSKSPVPLIELCSIKKSNIDKILRPLVECLEEAEIMEIKSVRE